MVKNNKIKELSISSINVEELLEFDIIRNNLSKCTSLSKSKKKALNFKPSVDFDLTCKLQEETEEGILLINEKDYISFDSVSDFTDDLQQAKLERIITGKSLINISEFIKLSIDLKKNIKELDKKTPHLKKLSLDIENLTNINTTILKQISNNGTILDNASKELKKLRTETKIKYKKLTDFLSKYKDKIDRNILQSSNISSKNNRLVLEVKSERRQNVSGIVHDVSQSGSTLFIEPLESINLCNEWRETSNLIYREEERILKNLTKLISSNFEKISKTYNSISKIDFILARSKLSIKMKGSQIITTNFKISDSPIVLKDARHPLLGNQAIPIDISLGPNFNCLVITGPNTGGKTIALKTVGILSLMHQSGLRITANPKSKLAVFKNIFIDIGDQQDINNSTSTFSAHIKNVINILKQTTKNTLVLLDELGSGTDPVEGSALACAILKVLAEKKIPTIITTHHRNITEFADKTIGCINASVDLHPETMMPTYKLTIGRPSISYAISVATQLGMNKQIIKNAKTFIDSNHKKSQELLKKIQKDQEEIDFKLQEIEIIKSDLNNEKKVLSNEINNFNNKQKKLIEETRTKLLSYIQKKRLELKNLKNKITLDQKKSLSKNIKIIEKSIISNKTLDSNENNKFDLPENLIIGDTVRIFGMNTTAKIKKILPENKFQLLMGKVTIELSGERISKINGFLENNKEVENLSSRLNKKFTPKLSTLDVRGMRTINLYDSITKFIDDCILNDLKECKIIHGVGKKILQQEVKLILTKMAEVSSFKYEKNKFGEESITIIELI
ncbi:MAG: hypothetical protein CL764_00950 [Chloroflexi bacterium]|nr:hypothetical protein [Chloroflexota bacterium]|tara:strand:+ start:4744 stop:7122 length:2379 start_codon:yes stop_codon:yes gene_type:complete